MTRTREDAAYIAMLEDCVVAAATVLFGKAGVSERESDYLLEGIYEQAKDITETVPRLKGAWTP